jgi:PEGA domain-containing protein
MPRMLRNIRQVRVVGFLSIAALVAVSGLRPGEVRAQTQPRPPVKGKYKLKIDSSPQQAAVYWDSSATPQPKLYGIAGYTPITIKVPKGQVKIVLELSGFKPIEQVLDVRKNTTITPTLERAPRLARLDLQSSSDAAGGEVLIDGVPRGTIPNSFELAAGRHQIEVRKAGHKNFTDWVDLQEGERRTRDVSMERAEAPTGTLLVNSDAGGEVWVDGQRKDAAPAIVSGLPAGDHVVEVKKDGYPPWRQTVTIAAGQQVKVAANFGAATNSSLRIISNEPDVEVFVDGEQKGKAPVTIQGIKPGEHIVGGRKTRFKPVEQTVRVQPGENAIVSFRMEVAPPDRPRATLKVQSQVPNAEVFLDGSSLGRAPIDRNDLDPGKHYVVVHKDGFTDFKREVVLLENQTMTLVADLAATGTVRILSSPEGADVKIDGELIGKTPVQRDAVPSGDHIVEFKMKGFFDHKETMKIEGGREKVFSVDLKALPSGPSPEQVARRKTAMSSFGAKTNPVGGVTSDFGIGYPYYLTVRLAVGAVGKPGIDVGVEFQTFFSIADLALFGKIQLVEAGPFALGSRLSLGGGTGVNGRDTYFLDAAMIASLAFGSVATVNGSIRYSAWSDKFCPSGTQRSNGVDADAFCDSAAYWTANDPMQLFDQNPNGNRFTGQRLYFGIGITAAIDRFMSFFFQIEGLPFADQLSYKPRLAFMDAYNGALIAKNDHFVYGMAGLSLKF